MIYVTVHFSPICDRLFCLKKNRTLASVFSKKLLKLIYNFCLCFCSPYITLFSLYFRLHFLGKFEMVMSLFSHVVKVWILYSPYRKVFLQCNLTHTQKFRPRFSYFTECYLFSLTFAGNNIICQVHVLLVMRYVFMPSVYVCLCFFFTTYCIYLST